MDAEKLSQLTQKVIGDAAGAQSSRTIFSYASLEDIRRMYGPTRELPHLVPHAKKIWQIIQS